MKASFRIDDIGIGGHIPPVKAKKAAPAVLSEPAEKTPGMKLVEKYRPRMSRLTEAERRKLMERGLQIVSAENLE